MTELEALRISQFVNVYCRSRGEALYYRPDDEPEGKDWYVVLTVRPELNKSEEQLQEQSAKYLDSGNQIYTRAVDDGKHILIADSLKVLTMRPLLDIE